MNKAAFISATILTLAELTTREFHNITNVATQKLICYTKPVSLGEYGYMSILHVIDKNTKTSIPEVQIMATEQELLNALQSVKSYNVDVRQVSASHLKDQVPVEYSLRSRDTLSSYIPLATYNVAEIFGSIVVECLKTLEEYFAAANYDANTILFGYDYPTDGLQHAGKVFQFLNCELVFELSMFRTAYDVNGKPYADYDFNVGLDLTAMRSGKNDAIFNGVL